MKISPIHPADFHRIKHLKPDGWPDLIPEFQFYCKHDFCLPYKAELQGETVGLGTIILFRGTAWLAHIIVDKNQRNQGIGKTIVQFLLRELENHNLKSISLIATPLGKPVYQKCGFRVVSEYTFLRRKEAWFAPVGEGNVIDFQDEYRESLLKLDKEITGEDREDLLNKYLPQARIMVNGPSIEGYYFPNLREGAIFAPSAFAGIELMKQKFAKADKAVIPSENTTAIQFLEQHGFQKVASNGTRMILGEDIPWKPENYYSRIGGNFG